MVSAPGLDVAASQKERMVVTNDDWEKLVNQHADAAPGTYLQEGEVLSSGLGRGEEDLVPMKIESLRFKGYVEVWDNRTGILSLQPWWLLYQTMRKRREDGSLVFTRTNPHIAPDYGEDLFCPLNPDAPQDGYLPNFSGRGFRPCRKKHIPHQEGLERHVIKTHGRAWEAMQRERVAREREEDRQLQREQIESNREIMRMMARQQMGNVDISSVTQSAIVEPANFSYVPAPTEPVKVRVPRLQREGHRTCEVCGEEFTGKNNGGATLLLARHKKAAHPVSE